jgi:uncharacterized membrane protein
VCAALRVPTWVRVLAAAAVMVGMDGLIEPVAIDLGWWHWFGQAIPVQNYVAWFIIGAGLIGVFHRLGAVHHNPLAPYILGAQFFFFTAHHLAFLLR